MSNGSRIEHFCDMIPKAESWLVLNLQFSCLFTFISMSRDQNDDLVRACSHETGAVNYPGVMIAPGQALPRVHMMICCPGATLPLDNFIAPGQVHRHLITTHLSAFL